MILHGRYLVFVQYTNLDCPSVLTVSVFSNCYIVLTCCMLLL